jgi:aryl-phospho-beta-D-glucosidase BglC (GH1 family)
MKKVIWGVCLILTCFCGVSAAASDLKEGLILHYNFDADEGASVTDQSGQGHQGTVNGAAFAPEGRFGGAYHFDGLDDYISAGNLGFHATGTISFWMKADTVENWRNPFTTDYAGWDDCIRFEESSSGSFMGGGHGLGRGGNYTESLVPNQWYHVVYAWDDTYVYGFLDGALRFKNPHPDPDSLVHPDLPLTAGQYKEITLNFQNVAIGNGYSTETERFWKGLVDDVRVYDRALSIGEVVDLYENQDDALVLYFPFDSVPQGGAIEDQSGKGNNGVVSGNVTFLPGEGKGTGALEFHGTNESIFIPKSDSLNVGQQLTFAAWYKPYDRSNLPLSEQQNPILEYSDGQTAGAHLWTNVIGYQWNGKGTGANLVDTTGDDVNYVVSTGDKPVNEWHHLVVTYDGVTNTGRVYIDGLLAETRQFSSSFTPQTAYDLYIGRRIWDHQIYKGLLDEVRIYNRALSDHEVRALYDATGLGLVYQNFEDNNGSSEYGWPINGATAARSTTRHSGAYSWKVSFASDWGGTGIPSQVETWNFNAQPQRHDRLTFWVLAKPAAANTKSSVRVRFFDQSSGTYHTDGFELTATRKAAYNTWTPVTVLFSQLPSVFDLKTVDKIQFVFANEADTDPAPGTYFIDDIQIESRDRYYQDFEQWSCSAANPGDCGWAWNGSIGISNTVRYNGTQAWKLNGTTYWNGTGIKSQEKRCVPPDTCASQDFWHVDINPEHLDPRQYDRLTFWVQQLGNNGMANNVEIKFFDRGQYDNTSEGAKFWTQKSGDYGQWARLTVPFDQLPADLNLTDLDNIQLSVYWPGTYYFDDIRATKGAEIKIDPAYLSSGIVTWNRVVGAIRYTLQESTRGPTGPWTTLCPDPNNPDCPVDGGTAFPYKRLNASWLRVRWETAGDPVKNLVSYQSDWSDTVRYLPRPVLIKNDWLQKYGIIEWTFIPQATRYEIQQADTKNGTWTTIYTGGYRIPPPLTATPGKWYRIRGLRTNASAQVIEMSSWGPTYLYDPYAFLRAVGTKIKEQNGSGAEVKLRGVNLGNFFLIEPWMLGTGAYQGQFPDDWTIRQKMGDDAADLIAVYENTYIQDVDIDNIMRTGANLVRLPVYYRNIRELDEETGQWLPGTDFDFSAVDRIVNLCADRGLYVLLDLHGAPGGQNAEFHSGREGYNKLFAPDPLGAEYRERTKELWRAIVDHYRDNTLVAGYDLLNEPVGVYAYSPGDPAPLWDLYDQLYHVIRDADKGADAHHIIMMEGVWDWETLPNPSVYGWQNVTYQFHYYCQQPAQGEDPVSGQTCPGVNPTAGNPEDVVLPETHLAYQKAFIDAKIANSRQGLYKVPAMVGEFNGYGLKSVWDYYFQKFNGRGYHWAMWSYKTHEYPSSWGLYNHNLYDDLLPDFDLDDKDALERKFLKYDTLIHHAPNTSLINIFKKYTPQRSLVQ